LRCFRHPGSRAGHDRRFKLQIEDRAGLGYDALNDAPRRSSPKPRRRRNWPALFSSYQVNVPQLYADIDRTKARQLACP